MKGINAKIEDFYEDKGVEGTYGEVWSTNANDSTAPNKITSTNNRWAPTIFAYEDVDPSNGISDGYSDAKITTYNLSTTGTTFWLSSRSVYADWGYAHFYFRSMSGSGAFGNYYVFHSGAGVGSYCYGLRPVLQVSK